MDIKFFKDIDENDSIGGKGANLAKMLQHRFNVPNGFVISANIFNNYLDENNLKEDINKLIQECDINDEKKTEYISNQIISILDKCNISDFIQDKIVDNYKLLNSKEVAVRSSATSEDGKNHAWAGQLETFLNVDESNIIEAVKKCWCSIFSPRALFYRLKNNDVSDIAVAVVVQEMVQSEESGIAFSINPTTNNQNEIVIEAVLGLGEAIVSGKVSPDTYIIDKNSNIISKEIKDQKIKLVNSEWILAEDGNSQKLNDDKIRELSNTIKEIEGLYGFPVDIEWGIRNNRIYILQCRPITTIKDNNLINIIKRAGDWKFYVSRKFNWFVENTEIYSTLENIQKEVLGFELAVQNYLCLNGDEYSLDTDFDILCEKLDRLFNADVNFFDKFAKIEMDIVDEVNKYIDYLKNKNLGELDTDGLINEFKQFNNLYIKSFIAGMTRPEDYLTKTLEEELINQNYNRQDIDNIFAKISTCPNEIPLSYSEEPLDLLKIALESKNETNIDDLINKHIEKYAWIKGPLEFEDTCFTKEEYIERLNNLANDNIEEKIENILQVRKNNDIEYISILKQYSFSTKILKLIEAIRNFIFLRTYTTEYSDKLFYTGRHTIFKEITQRTNVVDSDLIMLTDKEILDIINNGKMDSEIAELLEDRKKGFAMIWINGAISTVFGDESVDIQNEIAKVYKTTDDTYIDVEDVIAGDIANKGKASGIARILTSYEDIYKVQKGDIIVATMTTPDYIFAMEKAAAFITDEGGITCHAAILSREFNVPCIVGTIDATDKIKDGDLIEVDAYNGKIYKI